TDSAEVIHAAAVASSAGACHGATSCAGMPIGGEFTINCGSPICGTTGCGKPGVGPLMVCREQPRETYQADAVQGGPVCDVYQPAPPQLLTNSCCIVDEE